MPEIFARIVTDWTEELLGLGFTDADALFPDERHLHRRIIGRLARDIQAMSSTHAATAAFKVASEPLGQAFSPHSAKHCIGQLGWRVCQTSEEHKAWSMNMGHDDESVTRRHDAKIPTDRIFEIFDRFGDPEEESLEDKELMLRFAESDLVRDSPQWHRAKTLRHRRSKRRGGMGG